MTTLDPRLREAGFARAHLEQARTRRPVNRSGPLVPLFMDAAALIGATVTAAVVYGHVRWSRASPIPWLVAFDVLVLVVLTLRRTYRFRLAGSLLDELRSAVIAPAIATVIILAVRASISFDPGAAAQTIPWGALASLNFAVVRTTSHVVRRKRFLAGGGYKTLVVGAGSVGRQVARRLLQHPEFGLRPIGFLDKEPRQHIADDLLELPVLGASWDLERLAGAYDVDHVVVAFSTAPHQVLVDIVRRSQMLELHVLMVPRLFEEVPLGNEVEFVGGVPLLRVEPAAKGWQLRVKYSLDRVVAALALLLMAPMLLMAALAVRRSSPGPIFFRQRRVGLDGREFDMLKFRTMVGSASVEGEGDAGWVAGILTGTELDTGCGQAVDRRTPVGRVLRKCSVDELPQLINVLRGEMSIVGPRPERATLVTAFNENVYRYADRHRMKCGMTGWAQVHNLRGETSLADRIEWDNRYIQHWTLWLDLKILLLTIPALLRGE